MLDNNKLLDFIIKNDPEFCRFNFSHNIKYENITALFNNDNFELIDTKKSFLHTRQGNFD